MSGVVAAGHPAHRRGRRRGAARGRQRRRRRGRRGARLVRGREPADRLRRRRLHARRDAGRDETTLLDFFVAAPGHGRDRARAPSWSPVPVHFDAETDQTFYVGPASCGVPGTAAGLERALRALRLGAAGRAGRAGGAARPRGRAGQRPAGLHPRHPGADPRAPRGHPRALRAARADAAGGRAFRFPELAEALERFGAEGAEPFYRGEVAAALTEFVVEQRRHARPRATSPPTRRSSGGRSRAPFRGGEVLTNPPPSSGGILIAYCLGLLERLGERSGPEQLVAAMGAANEASRRGVRRGPLRARGSRRAILDPGGLDLAAADAARLDHPHLGPRRRRDLRQRHLLQRLGLGRPRAGHRA